MSAPSRMSRLKSFGKTYWLVILVIICLCVWMFWPSSKPTDNQTAATTTTTAMTAQEYTAWLSNISTKTYNRVFQECRAKQAAASRAPTRFIDARVTDIREDGSRRVFMLRVPAKN